MKTRPTEPTTEAGRRLVAAYPANAADAASPEFIRHMVRSILAIEAEAHADAHRTDAPSLRSPTPCPTCGFDGAAVVHRCESGMVRWPVRPEAHADALDVDALAEALQRLDTGPDGLEYGHTYAVDSAAEFAKAIAVEYRAILAERQR